MDSQTIRACGDVAEYQITVSTEHSLTQLRIDIEPVPGCVDPSGVVKRLEQGFQDAFALRVPVRRLATGTLPRFEMKAKRWIKL